MRINNIWPWIICGAIFLFIQSIPNFLFVVEEFNYLAQPYDTRGLAKGGIYFLTYLACITAIYCIVLAENKFISRIGMTWIGFSVFIDLFIQALGSYRGFSTEELKLALSQYQLAANLLAYIKEIISGLIGSLVVCSILILIRNKSAKRIKSFCLKQL